MNETKSTWFWVAAILILLLVASNGYWLLGGRGMMAGSSNSAEVGPPVNAKIVNFLKLFIDKVLKADKEIDFETRLQLENSVRDLNDKEILVAWQKFTASKTEAEAQLEVNNLLTLLVGKLKTQ